MTKYINGEKSQSRMYTLIFLKLKTQSEQKHRGQGQVFGKHIYPRESKNVSKGHISTRT